MTVELWLYVCLCGFLGWFKKSDKNLCTIDVTGYVEWHQTFDSESDKKKVFLKSSKLFSFQIVAFQGKGYSENNYIQNIITCNESYKWNEAI